MKFIKDLKKLFKEDELKENTTHGQELTQIGSRTYDIKKDEIYL